MLLRELAEELRRLRRTGDWPAAEKLLLQWSEGRELHDRTWALQSLMYFALGEGLFEQARECCEAVLSLHPDDPYARSDLGLIYRLLGEWDAAETELRVAIADERVNAANRFVHLTQLGKVLLAQGRIDECLALCEFTKDDPSVHEAEVPALALVSRLKLLARVYQKQSRRQDAAEALREALRIMSASRTLGCEEDLLDELAELVRS